MQNYNPAIGDLVLYAGRAYKVIGVQLGGVAGPYCRLVAQGDYANESLTSVRLLRPLTSLLAAREVNMKPETPLAVVNDRRLELGFQPIN